MIILSACLTGVNCKYSGGNNLHPVFKELTEKHPVLLICPEQLGGLETPRPACEILGGDGKDVLEGNARVLNNQGEDVTPAFIAGAKQSLDLAKQNNIKLAVLKSRSPSCGAGLIYDGSFNSKLQAGDGVTTALFRQHQIEVISDTEFLERWKKGEIEVIESN